MNPAAKRVLDVARGELGVHESPLKSNSVKYNRAYYKSDVRAAWCVVFQWWCFQRAGVPTSVFPKSASVFAVRDWYKKQGRFNHTPKVGALVIFSFSHIGIVEKVLPGGRIRTIEGNTDPAGSRTGGQVMRKIRSHGIQGYCHPDWSKAGAGPKRPVTTGPGSPSAPHGPGRPAHGGGAVTQTLESLFTSVSAQNVRLPARRYTPICFTRSTANEGAFWAAPRDGRGGFAIARGAGLFVADVTLKVHGLPPGTLLLARLIETDPAHGFKQVGSYASTEFRVTAGGQAFKHATTSSRLEPGRHLLVEVYSSAALVLPEIRAEVVFLRRRRV